MGLEKNKKAENTCVHGTGKNKKTEAMHLRAWVWRRLKNVGNAPTCMGLEKNKKNGGNSPACMGLEKNKKAEGAYVHGTSVQRTI
jgi:hypothetical protein